MRHSWSWTRARHGGAAARALLLAAPAPASKRRPATPACLATLSLPVPPAHAPHADTALPQINSDPYGAWFAKVKLSNKADLEELMDAKAYEDFCA